MKRFWHSPSGYLSKLHMQFNLVDLAWVSCQVRPRKAKRKQHWGTVIFEEECNSYGRIWMDFMWWSGWPSTDHMRSWLLWCVDTVNRHTWKDTTSSRLTAQSTKIKLYFHLCPRHSGTIWRFFFFFSHWLERLKPHCLQNRKQRISHSERTFLWLHSSDKTDELKERKPTVHTLTVRADVPVMQKSFFSFLQSL